MKMSQVERSELIFTCSLLTGKAESFFENMTDAELWLVYDEQMSKAIYG